MADIGAELLEKIRAEFQKNCKADKYIQSVLKKIEGGTAKMEEVALLSKQLGRRASQAIGAYVNAGVLPDGKMYYNIADTILTGVLKDNYDIINSAAAECQKALDKQAGIHISPQQAEFPTERVQAVANAASVHDIAEEVMIRRMTAPAQNITESFYNDYVQTNVKFRSDAGLDCYIIRNDHGGCCEWCAKLAGKYHYPEDVPKDVYRRHDNCGCTVTYLNGRKAQDVWDKTKWNVSDEELERMKKAGAREPVRLKGKVVTKEPIRLVDNGKKYGIMKSWAISGALNPDSDRAIAHAERYYEAVRHMKNDVHQIALNTGFDENDIREIKNFIFMEKHDLGGVVDYFYPDYMMAQSWQRLIDGKNIQPHDITLLNHERMERQLMKQGHTQNEAHTITSKTYNYSKEAAEYYDKIGEHTKT